LSHELTALLVLPAAVCPQLADAAQYPCDGLSAAGTEQRSFGLGIMPGIEGAADLLWDHWL